MTWSPKRIARVGFQLDVGLELLLDRENEVAAITFELECEEVVASSPASSSRRHGQMRRRSGYGHGMCQKSAVRPSVGASRRAAATSAR